MDFEIWKLDHRFFLQFVSSRIRCADSELLSKILVDISAGWNQSRPDSKKYFLGALITELCLTLPEGDPAEWPEQHQALALELSGDVSPWELEMERTE